MKRIGSFLLACILLFTSIPIQASAEEVKGEITRIQWIKTLVSTFQLYVEEDNYPDNYYSDISEEDEFYRDVMLACEFGAIDVEAGGELRPNDPATREFAAYSLNELLGFVVESETYSYSDADAVVHKDSAQIAIDRGWFALIDGAFVPQQAITENEKAVMIADANKVLEESRIDLGNENTIECSEAVIMIPESADVSIDVENNLVAIKNSPENIVANDVFVVYANGIPFAYQAVSVSNSGEYLMIETTDAPDGTITDINYQGAVDADMEQFAPADAATYACAGYMVYESATKGVTYDGKTLSANKTVSIANGVTATFNIVVNNMKVNYRLEKDNYYLSLTGDLRYSCNVKGDAFSDLGVSHELTLGAVPLGDIGVATIGMVYNLSGEATLTVNNNFETGFAYSNGLRYVGSFQRKGYSFSAEANVKAGVNIAAQASLGVVSGSLAASCGAVLSLKAVNYSSGAPSTCISQAMYLYANVSADASLGIGIFKRKLGSKTWEIWNAANSPVRVYYHYEDGRCVSRCTREAEFKKNGGWTNYYTASKSKYFNPYGVASYIDYSSGEGVVVPIFTYELTEDKKAIITGYTGTAGALRIPQEVDGYPVVAIGSYAFSNRKDFTTVSLPDSITEIRYSAFNGCSSLKNVSLSKNLVEIGGSAFGNCTALEKIEIPKSMEKDTTERYYSGPFYGCTNLKEVVLEEGITRIPSCLLKDCKSIETMHIPDSVTSIGYCAFRNASGLKAITIPNNVTKIGESAFDGCSSLTEITIPNNVTKIGDSAFYGCTSLKNVSLSKNLVEIGGSAFADCTSLEKIDFPKLLENIGNSAFQNCDKLTSLTFPEKLASVGRYGFNDCDALVSVTMTDNTKTIGDHCFLHCDALTTVTLSAGLNKIPSGCFESCIKLPEITIPYYVKTIDNYAFKNCSALKKIYLPRGLTAIGETETFSYPDRLTIYGVPDTYAQTYAKEHGFAFQDGSVAATAITISDTDLMMTAGESKQLTIAVTPKNFTDAIVWKSSDTNVVKVNETGLLKAAGGGTATVKVTVGKVSATCKVVVKKAVTGISIDNYDLELHAGDKEQLRVTVYPEDAYNKALTWETSDNKVATVDSNGCITAVGKGECRITARSTDGSNVSDYVVVTVLDTLIPVTKISDFASKHPYDADTNTTWKYTQAGASKLSITFDANTYVEEDYDYIYIYDKNKKQIGEYTGNTLSGKTIVVSGDTVYVTLITDEAGNEYGFRVVDVKVPTNQVISYNIRLDGNGATEGSTQSLSGCRNNVSYTLPTNGYKRNGYAFLGWNTKPDGSGKTFNDKASVTNLTNQNGATVVLYAKWSPIKYTVTYKLNGGKNHSKNPAFYYVTTNTVKLAKPTRKGYTFKGWYKDSKYKTKITQIPKGTVGNQTLYAKWAKTKYTIKYALKGGKNSKKNPSYYYVTSKTIKLAKPTRKGYTFKGWYKDSKYKSKVTQIKKGSVGNRKLYAKWKKK